MKRTTFFIGEIHVPIESRASSLFKSFSVSLNTTSKRQRKEDPLTSVTIDENFLLPCHMCMIILVTDGHRQGAGHCFGWTATVAHDNRNEELFLALAVKCPQSC